MLRLSLISACWPAMLICTLLAGCMQLEKPYPQKQSYVLEARRGGDSPAAPIGTRLLIRNLGSSARYRSKNFIYRLSDLQYQADFYHEFFTSPSAMIAEESGLWLQQAGLFSQIVEGGTPPPTHILRSKIGALYGDFTPGQPATAILEIQFVLIADRDINPQTLLNRNYRRSIPLVDHSPETLLRGWNLALKEILTEFEGDLQNILVPAESADLEPPLRQSSAASVLDVSPRKNCSRRRWPTPRNPVFTSPG
jgi:hypothetical protein